MPAAPQSLPLPAGVAVTSTAISGNRVLLFGSDADGKQLIVIHDIGTGKTVTQIDVK